jgi:multiple sugar transport system permease protein
MARKSILSKLGTALLVFIIVSPALLFFIWMLSRWLK